MEITSLSGPHGLFLGKVTSFHWKGFLYFWCCQCYNDSLKLLVALFGVCRNPTHSGFSQNKEGVCYWLLWLKGPEKVSVHGWPFPGIQMMTLWLLPLVLGYAFLSVGFRCRWVFPLKWPNGHNQLQTYILLPLKMGEKEHFAFLVIPLLGLSLIAPTWVMSPGWKLLVTSAPPRRMGVHDLFYSNHLDWKSGRWSSFQRRKSRFISPEGAATTRLSTQETAAPFCFKCSCPFTFMHKVVSQNLENKSHLSTLSASGPMPLVQVGAFPWKPFIVKL